MEREEEKDRGECVVGHDVPEFRFVDSVHDSCFTSTHVRIACTTSFHVPVRWMVMISQNGGAIYNSGGTLTITASVFTGNTAVRRLAQSAFASGGTHIGLYKNP